ncbi:TPA: site-specific DNA-methyltransferase [Yersinia enterocolitica]|nr:site-specific DNA-methyltransferase [Yersinia enterocolitica]
MLLLQGNCLDLMCDIPDASIDMILCDLPYGTTNCSWDFVIPFDSLWTQYKRVIRGNGAIVLTASQPFTSALVMSNIGWFKYQWVWKKNRATGHVHAKNKPMKIHEDICVFSSGVTLHEGQSENRMDYHPQGLIELPAGTKTRKRNDAGDNSVMAKRTSHKETSRTHTGYPVSVIEFPVDVNNGTRVHPTQKPLSLMEYLILTYTNKGDTVLDNCMGSGTTGVACVNTMRDFVGMELDKEYFQIASDRINQSLKLVEGECRC